MKANYVVIGLGRFGQSIVRTLRNESCEVMAIDSQQKVLEEISDEVDSALCLDATDEKSIAGLELEKKDVVIVGMGGAHLESSILIVSLLHQMGVKKIVARGVTEQHARVLRAVGAHSIVNPEVAMGQVIAQQLIYPGVLGRFQLGQNLVVAEVDVPQQLVSQDLAECDLQAKDGIAVVAIKRKDDIHIAVSGDFKLEKDDVLVVIGRSRDVNRFSKRV